MTYRYPWRAMAPDYARAAIGLLCTATPALLMDLASLVSGVLAFLAAIFLLFGAQAALRHATRILVSDRDIRALPSGTRLDWDGLTRLRLAYFSVRRDGRSGWMELKLQSGRRTLRIDSRLEGFSEVVRQAAAAATGACLQLDTSTLGNLATLGIGVRGTPEAGEQG
jgi:hypothetical protein